MDFKQLEAFILVADLGSFSKTAKQLHVTQPTVSAYISALENEMGCRLIDRLPGEARASETGKQLYNYATEIIALRNKVYATCKRQATGVGGTISLAASSIPYQYVLPVIMAEFRMKYPDVQFEVSSSDSESAAQKVLAGTAEIAMTGTLNKDRHLIYEPVMEDELVVITPAAEPYQNLKKDSFGLQDLIKAPFIVREVGSGTRKETEGYLNKLGYETGALNIVATMDNADAVIKGVSQGLGISIVSRLSATDYERFGMIKIFRLAEGQMRRKLYIVRSKDRPLAPATESFIRFITRQNGH